MVQTLRTRAHWLFVVVGFCQLAALVLIGHTTVALKGMLIACALVIWLGHGSSAAWWLLVVSNAAQLVVALSVVLSSSSGSSFGTRIDRGDVIALIAGSSALLAILLSGGMRTALRGGHPSGATRSARRDSTLA
jgi:hypothetical protein